MIPQYILKIDTLANNVNSLSVLYTHQNSCYSRDQVISLPTETQMNKSIGPS